MKKMLVEIEVYSVEDLSEGAVNKGSYIEYKDEIYKFDGYDFGTYPMATNIKTKEQIQLPHY